MKKCQIKRILGNTFILLLVLVIAPIAIACGKSQPTSTSTPKIPSPFQSTSSPQTPPSSPVFTPSGTTGGGNQAPVISNLSAAKNQLYPNSTTEIQIVTADPDGDKVDISWQCTGGSFFGSGYVIQWQSPKEYGNYVITAVVTDGKGGTTQRSITIGVVTNQPPQITSLSAKPQVIGVGGQSIISCIATDPEGDTITFNWKPDEGTITGVGPTVTWTAPNKAATFVILVTVTDSKGAESKQTVSVTTGETTRTTTLSVLKEETGTIDSTGDRDSTRTRAGDDDKGIGYRCFWSFNIFSLNNTDIKSAKLIFGNARITGDPFVRGGSQTLSGLFIRQVQYSDKIPRFDITGTQLSKFTASVYEQPNIIDITTELAYLVNSAGDRFQIEALFDKVTNASGTSDSIEWITELKLEVTYTQK